MITPHKTDALDTELRTLLRKTGYEVCIEPKGKATAFIVDGEGAMVQILRSIIQNHYLSREAVREAINSAEIVNVMVKMERERIKQALGLEGGDNE